MTVRVLTIFGTRPEAIKLAPVLAELRRRGRDGIESVVCVTGQHREMLDQVLSLFHIAPHHDLQAMRPNQTLTQLFATVMERLEPVLVATRPDWVVVQGDTGTVAAAALAAFYHRARIAHVEAGLRTHDRWNPFPEEINRRVASVVADLHFAPTARARAALLAENIPAGQVLVTGNPVIDAVRQAAAMPVPESAKRLLDAAFSGVAPNGGGGADPRRRLILVTAHRRENFGAPLEQVCQALRTVAVRFPQGVHIIYPVHLNPNVQSVVYRGLGGIPNITLTPPLDYLTLAHVMRRSHIVLTDSGGLQEEGPTFGTPVLVLREVTERPEAVEAGTVKLVGTDPGRIVREVERLLLDEPERLRAAKAVNPYGDGHASRRIVAALLGETVDEFLPATQDGVPLDARAVEIRSSG